MCVSEEGGGAWGQTGDGVRIHDSLNGTGDHSIETTHSSFEKLNLTSEVPGADAEGLAVGLGAHVVVFRKVARGDGPVANHEAVGHGHGEVIVADVDPFDEAAHEAGFARAPGADEEEAGAVVGVDLFSAEEPNERLDVFAFDFVGDVV